MVMVVRIVNYNVIRIRVRIVIFVMITDLHFLAMVCEDCDINDHDHETKAGL